MKKVISVLSLTALITSSVAIAGCNAPKNPPPTLSPFPSTETARVTAHIGTSPATSLIASDVLTASKTDVTVGEPVTFTLTWSGCAQNDPAHNGVGLGCEATLRSQDGSYKETKLTDARGQAFFTYTPTAVGTFAFEAGGHYWSPDPHAPVPLMGFMSNVVTVTVTKAVTKMAWSACIS